MYFGATLRGTTLKGSVKLAVEAAVLRAQQTGGTSWVVKVTTVYAQTDGYNCGIQCTWVWEQWIAYLNVHPRLAASFNGYLAVLRAGQTDRITFKSASAIGEARKELAAAIRKTSADISTGGLEWRQR